MNTGKYLIINMLSLVHCSSISGVLCSDIQAEAQNILVANAALPFRFNHKSGISTYPAFSFDYFEQLMLRCLILSIMIAVSCNCLCV